MQDYSHVFRALTHNKIANFKTKNLNTYPETCHVLLSKNLPVTENRLSAVSGALLM